MRNGKILAFIAAAVTALNVLSGCSFNSAQDFRWGLSDNDNLQGNNTGNSFRPSSASGSGSGSSGVLNNDTVYIGDDIWFDDTTDFSEGRAWIVFNERDLEKGSEQTFAEFLDIALKGKDALIKYGIENFSFDSGNRLAIIDTDGKILSAIPISSDDMNNCKKNSFKDGVSYIELNDVYYVFDSDGNLTYAHKCEEGDFKILGYGGGLFLVTKHIVNFDTNEWQIGVIDKYGNEVVPYKVYYVPVPKDLEPVEPPVGDPPDPQYDYWGYCDYYDQLEAYERYVEYLNLYTPKKISFDSSEYGIYDHDTFEYMGDGVFYLQFNHYGYYDIMLNVTTQETIYEASYENRYNDAPVVIEPFENGSTTVWYIDPTTGHRSIGTMTTDGVITTILTDIWTRYAISPLTNLNFSDGLAFIPYYDYETHTTQTYHSYIDQEYYQATDDRQGALEAELVVNTGAFYDCSGNMVLDFPNYNGKHGYICGAFHNGYAAMEVIGNDDIIYITAIDKNGNQMFDLRPGFYYAEVSDDGKYVIAANRDYLTVFDINGNQLVGVNYTSIGADSYGYDFFPYYLNFNVCDDVIRIKDFYINVKTGKKIGHPEYTDNNFSVEFY